MSEIQVGQINSTDGSTAITVSTGNTTLSGSLSMGTNNISFSNGNGIDFSASEGSGASSSVLDDYEEGTWTPTFANIGTGTYDTQQGKYVKVGSLVHIQCYIAMATLGSASGNLIIEGVPFTMQDINATPQMWTNSWVSNAENIVGLRSSGSNTFQMYRISNTNAANATHADMGGTGNLLFNMTYNTTQ